MGGLRQRESPDELDYTIRLIRRQEMAAARHRLDSGSGDGTYGALALVERDQSRSPSPRAPAR